MKRTLKAVYYFIQKGMPKRIHTRMDHLFQSLIHYTSNILSSLKPRRSGTDSRLPTRISKQLWPKDTPLLSVIILSSNHGNSISGISDTLASVLNQTFENYEVVLIDSSTDSATIRSLQAISHPKVRIVFRPEIRLIQDNLRCGLSMARGKYVCYLDPRTILKPSYFAKGLYLAEIGGYDVVSCGWHNSGGGATAWIPPRRPDLSDPPAQNLNTDCALFSVTVFKELVDAQNQKPPENSFEEKGSLELGVIALHARAINLLEPLCLRTLSKSNPIHSVTGRNRQDTIESSASTRIRLKKKTASYLDAERIIMDNGEINLLPVGPTYLDSHNVLMALPFMVVGGACKRFLEIAKFLKTNGYHLFILTTIAIQPEQVDYSSQFAPLTHEIYHLPLFLNADFDWRSFVIFFIKQKKIGTIFLGGSQFFYDQLPFLKNVFPHLRVIDQQFNTSIHFINNRKYAPFIDHTVAENQIIRDQLIQKYHENPNKISLIPNGVDVHGEYCPGSNSSSLRRPEEIPTDKLIISYIGRISLEKGPDIFIRIAKNFERNCDCCFILAGPGMPEESNRCKKLIRKLGLAEKVLFRNECVDPKQFLYYSDIIVIPSRLDGRPNLLLEALSMGKPVVTSKAGSMPEIIEHRKTGMLCDIENIQHFVQALSELMNNPALRFDMGKNAREYAVSHLDDSILLQPYLSVFSQGRQ